MNRKAGAWLVAACMFACGGSEADAQRDGAEEAVGNVAGAPVVEERYQERINEAWQEAVAGENPSATCGAIKGRAAVAEPGSAERALAACNLDIPVRYFLTYVERVEAGEANCTQLMTEVTTKLPGMTVSTEGFRDLATRGEAAELGDGAAAAAGSALVAGEAGAGGGSNDPRRSVKDRLREPVTAACPNEAAIILR